jgi:hypothetical protein
MFDWDRSHDWEVQRVWHDRTHVTIKLKQIPPSVKELASLRRCVPQLRKMTPRTARAAVSETGTFSLGMMPTPEALKFISEAEAQGLHIVAERTTIVSYLPYDRTDDCAWLIEDDSEARAIADSMIKSGVPVRESEG